MSWISRESCAYTASFCEENIWHLAQHTELAALDRRVVIITNPTRSCAVWAQQLAPSPEEPVVWDYHVLLLVEMDGKHWVLDLDTTLPFPCAFEDYVGASFRDIPPPFTAWFRVVEADLYCREFSSKRLHMRTEDGSWLAPPPPWPMILGAGALDLETALDLDRGPGEVMNLHAFLRMYRAA